MGFSDWSHVTGDFATLIGSHIQLKLKDPWLHEAKTKCEAQTAPTATPSFSQTKEKVDQQNTHDGTRTHNLILRRDTPCPLGHAGLAKQL